MNFKTSSSQQYTKPPRLLDMGRSVINNFRTTASGRRRTVGRRRTALAGGALLLSLVLLAYIDQGAVKEVVGNVSDLAFQYVKPSAVVINSQEIRSSKFVYVVVDENPYIRYA